MRTASTFLASLLILLLILSGCDSQELDSQVDPPGFDPLPPASEQIPDFATAWLKEEGHVLDTLNPRAALDDLEPLREIVGNARVVSIGEATHGTKEFYQIKHRIFRFLVNEMNFTAFAVEATMPEAFKLNEYVRTGSGDPAQRLDSLYFWTVNHQELLNQIRWMRDYNQRQSPNVGFYGFDNPYPALAMNVVVDFVENVDPDAVETVQERYSCYRRYADVDDVSGYIDAPDSTQQRCRKGVDAVSELLDENRGVYASRTSEREFSLVRQHARIVAQAERRYRLEDQDVRDPAMAKNVQWLLNFLGPDSKIVLSAHNGHVNEKCFSSSCMGTELNEALGENYVSIGFSFLRGRANAIEQLDFGEFGDLKAVTVPPPPDSSATRHYEWYFDSVGASPFLVDLRRAEEFSRESGWLYGPKKIREFGAAYGRNSDLQSRFFRSEDLVAQFDAMIYVEESSPTTLLAD